MSSYTDKPTLFAIPGLNGLTRMNSMSVSSSPSSLTIDELPETVQLLSKCHQFMLLKIFVDGPNDLYNKYANSVADHNAHVLSEEYVDSGFDLFAPINISSSRDSINKIDFKLKCSAQMVYDYGSGCKVANSGFYMYPRSSLSKTKLRLANSVGIIDAGYRGNLMGMFDCIKQKNGPNPEHGYIVMQYDRLVQICAPNLAPIYVEMVDNTDNLGESKRGCGGFGSSGR